MLSSSAWPSDFITQAQIVATRSARNCQLYHCNNITMMDLEDICARLFAYLRTGLDNTNPTANSSRDFPNNIAQPYWAQRIYHRGREYLWLLVKLSDNRYLLARAHGLVKYEVQLHYHDQASHLIGEVMTDFEYDCYSYQDDYCTRVAVTD